MESGAAITVAPELRLARAAMAFACVSIASFFLGTAVSVISSGSQFRIPNSALNALTYLSLVLLPTLALILGYLSRRADLGKRAMLISGVWLTFWVIIFRFWLATNSH